MKFDLSFSKLRKGPAFAEDAIEKCQTSNSKGGGRRTPCPPLPTAMITDRSTNYNYRRL